MTATRQALADDPVSAGADGAGPGKAAWWTAGRRVELKSPGDGSVDRAPTTTSTANAIAQASAVATTAACATRRRRSPGAAVTVRTPINSSENAAAPTAP